MSIAPAPMVTAATWVCVRDGRLLVVRPAGQDAFYLPGGTPEHGESLSDTTVREVAEETGVRLDPGSLRPLYEVTTDAYGRPGTTVRLVCFTGDGTGEPTPDAEIEEVAWFGPDDIDRCAPAVRMVVGDRGLAGLTGSRLDLRPAPPEPPR
ncbi:MAG: NUDIX domain-containing protein [Actinocatenispora sp.]